MSRRADMPPHLKMECIYLLRGHADRTYALRNNKPIAEGEAQKYRAVESALSVIEPPLRAKIVQSLTQRVGYEYSNACCGRQTFYRRRQTLLTAIAREMNYL